RGLPLTESQAIRHALLDLADRFCPTTDVEVVMPLAHLAAWALRTEYPTGRCAMTDEQTTDRRERVARALRDSLYPNLPDDTPLGDGWLRHADAAIAAYESLEPEYEQVLAEAAEGTCPTCESQIRFIALGPDPYGRSGVMACPDPWHR